MRIVAECKRERMGNELIICHVCNPFLVGNGYCSLHSTGGTSYKEVNGKPSEIETLTYVDENGMYHWREAK